MARKRLPKSHSNPIPEIKKEALKRSNSDSLASIPSNLQKCLVKDLKEYCAQLNLDVTGKKQELIEKINRERMRLGEELQGESREMMDSAQIEEPVQESSEPIFSGSISTGAVVNKQDVERVEIHPGQHSGHAEVNLIKPATRKKRGKGEKKIVKEKNEEAEHPPNTARVTKRKGKKIVSKATTKNQENIQENSVPDTIKENEEIHSKNIDQTNVSNVGSEVQVVNEANTEAKDISITSMYELQSKLNDLEDPDDSIGLGIQSTFGYKSIYPSLNDPAPVDRPNSLLQEIGSTIHREIITTGKSSLEYTNVTETVATFQSNKASEIPCKIQQMRNTLKEIASESTENRLESFYCALCNQNLSRENLGGKAIIQYLAVYLQDIRGNATKLKLKSDLPESKKDETSVCIDCILRNERFDEKDDNQSEISLTVDDYLPLKENTHKDVNSTGKREEIVLDDHGGLNLGFANDPQSNQEDSFNIPARPSKKRPYKAYSPTEVNAAIRNSPVAHSLPPTKKFKTSIPSYPVVSPSPMKKVMNLKKPKFSSILQSPLRKNIPKYQPKENEKVKERLDDLFSKVAPGSKEEWDLIHSASPRIPRD
ncbi:hypothetical protein HK103_001266 [Boothiomyces macroporosus]|uniref:SAP domain-containing protein n=1 Tax=Boothiomyces macroporosus TaxID=261099 RepID=A0AAD5UM81_9FUNG|nr:hypothetical protein HK103_001266 [Boothiomyces macroporosus]